MSTFEIVMAIINVVAIITIVKSYKTAIRNAKIRWRYFNV